MKAVVLTGIRQMEMQNVPNPKLTKDTDVLLKVAAVGVCGSDIHYYTEGRIGDQVVRYPFTVGHECTAIVEKIGSGVTRVKSGDHVVVDPAVVCGNCPQCLVGRSHTCLHLRFLGCPGQLQGSLSEYIVMPQECCYVIHTDTPLSHAVFAEPLSIGIYAVRQMNSPFSERIGILGAGPIGLSVLLALRKERRSTTYITDKIDKRLEVAKKFGADWIGNPNKSDEDIRNHQSPLLDTIFECCGEQDALNQSLELLRPGGKLLIVGIPNIDRVSFDISKLRRKEICIQNVRRQNKCIQAAIDLAEKNKTKIASLITHKFPFEKARDAFELVSSYENGVVKAVIQLI